MSIQLDLGKNGAIGIEYLIAAQTWKKAAGVACTLKVPMKEIKIGKSEPGKSHPVAIGESWDQTVAYGETSNPFEMKSEKFGFAGYEKLLAGLLGGGFGAPTLIGTTGYRHIFYPQKYSAAIGTAAIHGGGDVTKATLHELISFKLGKFKLSIKDGNSAASLDLAGLGSSLLQRNTVVGAGAGFLDTPTNTEAGLNALTYSGQDVLEQLLMLWMARKNSGYIRIKRIAASGDTALASTDDVYPNSVDFDYDTKLKGLATSDNEIEEPYPDGQADGKVELGFPSYVGANDPNTVLVKLLGDMRLKAQAASASTNVGFYYKMEMLFNGVGLADATAPYSLKIKFPKLDLTMDDPPLASMGARPAKLSLKLLQPDLIPAGMSMTNTISAPFEMELVNKKSSVDIA